MMKTVICAIQVVGITLSNIKLVQLFMIYFLRCGVGYYEPEQRVAWEAYDPKTGCADFHGFSKKEIKWLIDEDLSKNGG